MKIKDRESELRRIDRSVSHDLPSSGHALHSSSFILRPSSFLRRGFTLLELMIVIVIVLLLAAIVIPRMGGTMAEARLKGAARDVTGLLRFARDYAVVTERPCQVRFAPQKDSYQLFSLPPESGRADARYDRNSKDKVAKLMLPDDASGVHQLPLHVHFAVIYSEAPLSEEGGLPCVVYYPDGSATPALVAIQDDKKHAISVEIFRTTGMARVARGLPVETPKAAKLYYGPDHS